MNRSETIESLRKEASKNPAFNAVSHMLAIRKRSRHELNLRPLYYKMKDEGFNYSKEQYAEILKFLATVGCGKLRTSHRGNVLALTNVQYDLASIGAVACGQKTTLKETKANTVNRMPKKTFLSNYVRKAKEPTVQVKADEETVSINLKLQDKTLTVLVPKEITGNDISAVLNWLQNKSMPT